MKAWIIDKISDLNRESQPLKLTDIPEPVPEKGEILVKIKACGVCHTDDYAKHLWMEKELKSVANVTSDDVKNFLKAAAEIPIKPGVQLYPFEKANEALMDIKNRKIRGAKVLEL